MRPLSQQTNNRRETIPTSRTGGRESTIAKVRLHPLHTEISQSSQVIAVVARTRGNEFKCRNRANTLEQVHVVIERRVDRACTRCGMGLAASAEHHRQVGLTPQKKSC